MPCERLKHNTDKTCRAKKCNRLGSPYNCDCGKKARRAWCPKHGEKRFNHLRTPELGGSGVGITVSVETLPDIIKRAKNMNRKQI